MKVTQFGKVINSLDELKDGCVVIHSGYTVQDLPEKILIGPRVHIPRETWCEMVRVLAQKDKLEACLWVNQETAWNVKETKLFVEELLEDSHTNDDWISIDDELPIVGHPIKILQNESIDCFGFFRFGQWWYVTKNGETLKIIGITHWKYR